MNQIEHTSDENTVKLNKINRIASSGSKGNQRKWFKDNIWYKADFLGYEGLSEHMCTCLLKSSNIKLFAEYQAVMIHELDGPKEEISPGCMSYDFGNITTGDTIVMQLPERYNVWLNPKGQIEKDLLTFCEGVELIFGVDVSCEMKQMLSFDIIVGNEDRILRNFGLQQTDGKFHFAPLFDHGLSLLADIKSPERVSSLAEISFRPFGYRREQGFELLRSAPIRLNIKMFEASCQSIPVYPKKTIDWAFSILRKSLAETEGILWIGH